MFVRFEYDESAKSVALGSFRSTLARLQNAPVKGFSKGSMGSAQETFEEVLTYIHRASVFHQYSEMMLSSQTKSTMDSVELIIDTHPCEPQCAAHKIFTFEICELMFVVFCGSGTGKTTHHRTCQNCKEVINIDNVAPRNESMTRIYMNHFFESYKRFGENFESILRESILAAQVLSDVSGKLHEGCRAALAAAPVPSILEKSVCCLRLP